MQRRITPTARGQLHWITTTYCLTNQLDTWTTEIAAKAHDPNRPLTEIPLSEPIEELREFIGDKVSDSALSYRRFQESGVLDKLDMIRATVANRRPPCFLRLNVQAFSALSDGLFRVNVQAIYEIDIAQEVVTFYSFQHFSVSCMDSEGAVIRTAENW